MTARLRRLGAVRVEVLSQGRQRLWPQERQVLGSAVGHVREVVLRVDERPAVWARSSSPMRAVQGPWRAIRGLGTRPLAELLFTHRAVGRGPLLAWRLRTHGPQRTHLLRQWDKLDPGRAPTGLARSRAFADGPLWARHSLFHHHGQPLQVLEVFAPWLSQQTGPHG